MLHEIRSQGTEDERWWPPGVLYFVEGGTRLPMVQSSTTQGTWEVVKELLPGFLHVLNDESLESLRFGDSWNRFEHLVEHSLKHKKVYVV